jgi:two-component system, LytTR family, response regulator
MQTIISSTSANSLMLPASRGMTIINTHEIIRIEASSSYSRLFFSDGKKLLVTKVLGWFEQQLIASNFMRIHRAHLVNGRYIRHYTQCGKVQLYSGEYLDVARRKRSRFLSAWQVNVKNSQP